MNKKIINTIYKWFLRISYLKTLILGIILICFALTVFLTDYQISSIDSLSIFITIISAIVGLVLTIIGIIQHKEIEYGIKQDWHKKDID